MNVTHEVDEGAWRSFVNAHPSSSVFHTPEMFEVFSEARLQRPALWVATDEDALSALFVTVDTSVFDSIPLRYLSARSVVYGGILAVPGNQGVRAVETLLDRYKAQKNGTLFTEFRNVADTSEIQATLTLSGADFDDHLNFLIDLTLPNEEIWGRVRSNARRNIRKARKSGVTIAQISEIDQLEMGYEILTVAYKRIHVPLPDVSLFESAFRILLPLNMLSVLAAFVEGNMIGILYLLFHKGVATYWYTGTLKEYSGLRPSDLLVWSALETAIEMGARVFDFGGAGRPDEDYGVRDFKAKFGGDLVNYGRNLMVHAPTRFRLTTSAYGHLRRFL